MLLNRPGINSFPKFVMMNLFKMCFPLGDICMYYLMFITIRWLNGREWESKNLFHHFGDDKDMF